MRFSEPHRHYHQIHRQCWYIQMNIIIITHHQIVYTYKGGANVVSRYVGSSQIMARRNGGGKGYASSGVAQQ